MAIKNKEVEEISSEVEIFEFMVSKQSYGVNVLKIRQIIRFEPDKLSKPPKATPSLIGLIKILNRMVPIIDLGQAFYAKSNITSNAVNTESGSKVSETNSSNQIVIVLEFNRSWFGFLVDNVEKIHRFNSEDIKGVESGMSIEYVTSTVNFQNRTIFILDFEYLVLNLFNADSYLNIKPASSETFSNQFVDQRNILLVEDSKVVRDILFNFLTKVGYKKIDFAGNGKEGLEKYKSSIDKNSSKSKYDIVVSDIEMPIMDGFALCRKVKEINPNQVFVLLSSLASKQIQGQSQEAGVNKLVSKKDLDKLHLVIEDLCKEVF